MPVTIREFEKYTFVSSKKELIANFLEKNKDKAFKAKEISEETQIPFHIVAPYLHILRGDGKVDHKRPYWIYKNLTKKTDKEMLNVSQRTHINFLNRIIFSDEEKLWNRILNFKEKILTPLADRKKKQDFKITETIDDSIRISFLESGTKLKLEKSRFILAYRYLRKKKGKWIRIGATRVNTDPNSIEGIIKLGIDGNLNGLSTATWIAALLVRSNPKIIFNGKLRNQCLMYK